jgi:protein-L-isoaspartate(D-aspartate) O-methyltransferase
LCKKNSNFYKILFWLLRILKLQFFKIILEYGIIKTDKIAEVMKATDRKLYCRVANPYVDRPYSIGFGATISAPHMHVHALQILAKKLGPDAKVLDGKQQKLKYLPRL